MKKILAIFALLVVTLSASAQFEAGKRYVAGSFNHIGLSYNGSEKLKIGVAGHAGMFIGDDWLLKGELGFLHQNKNENAFSVGAGLRYYIIQNGLFLGLNAKGVFAEGRNDIMPGAELGYCFFLNDKLTLEPSIYYDQSFSSHKDYSTVGLKIGFGVYF